MRGEAGHAPQIKSLIEEDESYETTFNGYSDALKLVENGSLCVVAASPGDSAEVAGFASFASFPAHLTESIAPHAWPEYINGTYDVEGLSVGPGTAAFLTGAVLPDPSIATSVLASAFAAMVHVDTILLLLPSNARFPLPDSAVVVSPLPDQDGHFDVYALPRAEYVPKLTIRPAAVEDNDDLAPIFDAQSQLLSETYGTYFLSDLIENQDANNRTIVAEVDGYAVGLMALVADIDVTLLQECFELEPYNELLRPVHGFPLYSENQDDPARNGGDGNTAGGGGGDGGNGAGNENGALDEDAFLNVGIALNDDSPSHAARHPADRGESRSEASFGDSSSSNSLSRSSSSDSLSRSSSNSSLDSHSSSNSSNSSYPQHRHHSRQQQQQQQQRGGRSFKTGGQDEDLVLNAFALSLFCLDASYESRSLDFLPMAFEAFPDREYCILTLPHAAPEFPLLRHFSRVPPRTISTFPHVLYVVHRDALFPNLTIRRALSGDRDEVDRLLDGLERAGEVLGVFDDVMRLEAQERLQAMVFSSLETRIYVAAHGATDQVVGLFVTSSKMDISALCMGYEVDFVLDTGTRHSHSHHLLTEAVLNPMFVHHTAFVLDELLRISSSSALHYRLFSDSPVPPVLDAMIQVRPRRVRHFPAQVDHNAKLYYPRGACPESSPTDGAVLPGPLAYPFVEANFGPPGSVDDNTSFGLWSFVSKFVFEPKVVCNARIVVVGASDTGLSAIESLVVSTPYLHFSNITLISPEGLPSRAPDRTRGFLPHNLNYTERLLSQLALGASISVLPTKVMMIDRDLQAVMLGDGSVLPYEKLVLATGMQFVAPQLAPPEAPGEMGVPGDVLNGVFSLNSENDVPGLQTFAETNVIASNERVVVYGATREAHAAVYGLLAAGVAPESITFLLPPSSPASVSSSVASVSCFNEFFVDEAVATSVSALGLKLVRDLQVVGYEHRGGALLSVTLAEVGADGSPPDAADLIRLPCSMLVVASGLCVDSDIFQAINGCCLVYDGGLVIDAKFRTIDPAIYGGGPLTRFANRYYASDFRMSEYNSLEIGYLLADSVKEEYDEIGGNDDGETGDVLPLLEQPLAVGMALVSPPERPLFYFSFTGPGPVVPYATASESGVVSREITSKSQEDGSYVSLRLDEFGLVSSITYVGTAPIEGPNLLQLYGLPSSYLLLDDLSPGDDVLAHLRAPSRVALFHDGMGDLRNDMVAGLGEIPRGVLDGLDGWLEQEGGISDADRDVVVRMLMGDGPGGSAGGGGGREEAVLELLESWISRMQSEGLDMYHVRAHTHTRNAHAQA